MKKIHRILLLGAFLLCMLLGTFFTFSHIAAPAHAQTGAQEYYYRGYNDGRQSCTGTWTNEYDIIAGAAPQKAYSEGWWQGYHKAGCQ